MTTSTRTPPSALFAAAAFAAGAAVAVVLGVYGAAHEGSGRALTTLGFGSMLSMKVWLGLAVGVLGIGQLIGALWMYGRLGRPAPGWLGRAHRASGLLLVLVSLPVAFHCLWSIGFSTLDARTLVHSLAGCALYGALVTKVLVLRGRATPGWALPLAGGLLFTTLVAAVLTSSVWYLSAVGTP